MSQRDVAPAAVPSERPSDKAVFVDEGDLDKYRKEHPRRACDQLRYELKKCMLQTDCVQSGKTPRQCFDENDSSIPDQCFALRYRLFECKRSMIDMRTRFRGRKWDA